MKKTRLPSLLLAATALVAPSAFAASFVTPVSGDWGTGSNWDTGTVPAVGSGASAVIGNGAAVNYNGTALGDLVLNGGGSLTISAGSSVTTGQTNWTQVNNGTMTLIDGSFRRTATGQLTLSMANASSSTLNLTNSSVVIGGELWLGNPAGDDANQVAALNVYNSSLTTAGEVGMWIWDYSATGNRMSINFSGPAGSSLNVSDSIGSRANGAGANNATTWESLWSLGVLTAQGQSGLTGAAFSTYFTTTGSAVRDGGAYSLTYVPEPSGAALAGLTGALLLGRRRRSA